MTVLTPAMMAPPSGWRAASRQLLLVILTNVPTAMFGASLAWVSLASGSRGDDTRAARAAVAGGAGATHAAAVLGVALAAAALRWGRKPPLLAASAAFALCWGLKLAGGAPCLLAARLCAGLAGAAAWSAAPLLAREVSDGAVLGAASAAPVLAHNVGFLLMYAAADSSLSHNVILWSCLGVSLAHCILFVFAPESPSYLATQGNIKAARAALAWLRAAGADSAAVDKELRALPPADDVHQPPFAVVKELWRDRRRRRALAVGVAAVAGQESCGLLALLQFAEPVLAAAGEGAGAGAAGHALVLGAVQLIASALALYLVERVGRKPLIAWTALACGLCLCGGAGAAWARAGGPWLAAALAAAVAADSLGMQPAPYALLADMFHYRYRGCALALATAAAAAGNALEVGVFGAVAAAGGVPPAVALAAALTLLYAAFAFLVLPETRGKDPEDIYLILGPNLPDVSARDLEKAGEDLKQIPARNTPFDSTEDARKNHNSENDRPIDAPDATGGVRTNDIESEKQIDAKDAVIPSDSQQGKTVNDVELQKVTAVDKSADSKVIDSDKFNESTVITKQEPSRPVCDGVPETPLLMRTTSNIGVADKVTESSKVSADGSPSEVTVNSDCEKQTQWTSL